MLVVPLRMRGITRTVAFTRDEGVWRSHSAINSGFMPIRGDDAMPERNIRIAEDIVVLAMGQYGRAVMEERIFPVLLDDLRTAAGR